MSTHLPSDIKAILHILGEQLEKLNQCAVEERTMKLSEGVSQGNWLPCLTGWGEGDSTGLCTPLVRGFRPEWVMLQIGRLMLPY